MSEVIERFDDLPVSQVAVERGQDLLTEVLRRGARELLAQAIDQEVREWLEQRVALTDERGRRQVVRNGFLPERMIQTGIGPVEVRQPRVHDRRTGHDREVFSSKILPPYLRKTKSLEELIPWLSLKGISTGDFQEALSALVGPDCPGLSANTITRLKSVWQQDYEGWSKRSLAGQEYVYVWADGIHSNVRLEDDKVCLLVLIGVTKAGQKELLAVWDGHRESELSWSEVIGGTPLSRGAALQEAKLWLRNLTREQAEESVHRILKTDSKMPRGDRPYSDPYFWGAFLLFGGEVN